MKPADPQSTAKKDSSNTTRHPRLPCRGCLADCKFYATCDGRPWRADQSKLS